MSLSKIISEVGEEGLQERIAGEILNTMELMECAQSVEENREMYGRLKLLEELYGRGELTGALNSFPKPTKYYYAVVTSERFEQSLEELRKKQRGKDET